MLWLAPAVLALVVIPEFAQHVAEIRLGMFESVEQARSLQNDPTRWAFGYVKIAGLVLTFLAAARFWWTREHGGKWWDVRDLAWSRLALGTLIVFGVGSLPELLRGTLDETDHEGPRNGLDAVDLARPLHFVAGLFGRSVDAGRGDVATRLAMAAADRRAAGARLPSRELASFDEPSLGNGRRAGQALGTHDLGFIARRIAGGSGRHRLCTSAMRPLLRSQTKAAE